ncbi:MAG TPA: DNA-processing protein DprA [Gammaproteobacteria bacterium]|nr:DNA-processing protein DprA [Gammaproteobacteria bacterium]
MVASSPAGSQTGNLTDWLALSHTPGLGPARFRCLLESFRNPADILNAGRGQLHQFGLADGIIEALRHPDTRAIERDLEWLDKSGNRIMTCRDPDYPALLQEISDPPPLLYLHGNAEILQEPQLAVVGSRNPTAAGRQSAIDFARHLSAAGLVITSGLALGIDAAAHEGALDAGAPTVAVMGTGLDRVYPACNRELARAIPVAGLLVSEFPPGTPPKAENFPRRNRIISGLSLGILVVEAAIRSGSLISARFALEQGREVFAIPGSIHNPLARGCHHLIRQGAKLVETAQDIMEELGTLASAIDPDDLTATQTGDSDSPAELTEDYAQLLEYIGFDNTSVDTLVKTTHLTPAEVSSMLLQLEMRGYIAANPGGFYNRLK